MKEILNETIESYAIYADWLEEHGQDADSWRFGAASYAGMRAGLLRGGIGYGHGRGIGLGRGLGRGRGNGLGHGYGSGLGRGNAQ